jgi:FAD/FMN-containing dehydrogenase
MTASAQVPDQCVTRPGEHGVLVNDVHSQLNPTWVHRIVRPASPAAVQEAVLQARRDDIPVCIAGGRHAMGGQQFGGGATLLDMRGMNRVLGFDSRRGIVEVEAGIQWPGLVDWLVAAQRGRRWQWGIAQKQTGCDRLTLGGALSANVHGRGLRMRPIISDVESFTMVGADGRLHRCSRQQNPELFRLAIGGYGLFGIICAVTLRLTRRQKLRRVVELIDIKQLMPAFEQRIEAGYLYGDFQFAIDPQSEDFLRRGVFSCYRPVADDTPVRDRQMELRETDWHELLYLAHHDKSEAFRRYAEFYRATSGQIYWSDVHQLSVYLDDYHREIDQRTGRPRATEMITEIYVPRHRLVDFLDEARAYFRRQNADLIYGTIRLIERDDESFLAWAKQSYACVIFNLCTEHTPEGLAHAAAAFRELIDMAIRRDGSFYLTYHKFATRAQVTACYPQFGEFLTRKRAFDLEERFQSDWYRHYRTLFADCDR